MDGLFAFPFVLLSIALMTVLGTGMKNIIIVVSVVNIPGFTRIARGAALTVKELDFVDAARALGAKNSRLIFNHIFPNCMASLIVYATMSVAALSCPKQRCPSWVWASSRRIHLGAASSKLVRNICRSRRTCVFSPVSPSW